jgi:phage terminase small subunit
MRKRWRQILHDAPLNVLRPIDSAILTDFVVNEALAEQALAESGGELVVEGEKAKVRNPYLLVYFKAIEAKRAAMRELGFTPAARVGLPIEDSGNADPEDERWRWLVELGEKDKAERARLAKRKKTKRDALLATPPATPEVQ